MKGYIFLTISIVCEVFATAMLKMSEGFTVFSPSTGAVLGYGLCFYFLGLTLKILPLSLAYAIWAGVGTALTASVSVLLWDESLNILKIIGIVLIIGGVALLNMSKDSETSTTPSS